MRKILLSVIVTLSCLGANAQQKSDTLVSISKMTYEGLTELPGVYYSDLSETLELVSDGLALKNPQQLGEMWEPLFFVLGNLPLEEGHDYVVRLTLKVPSDGTYWVELCSWSQEYSCARQHSVVASHDFQIIDVEYPEYKCKAIDGMIILGWGWVVGTTILKEVELLEKTNTAGIKSIKSPQGADGAAYNLSGQKVNASYKGIVIRNGKKSLR